MNQKVIQNLNELMEWLSRHKIDFSKWGSGATKSLEDLLEEVQIGDTKLRTAKRIVEVAVVLIRSGEKYLIETKQVFADNRVRHRNWPPSEKLQLGESPEGAANRCLFEELGLRSDQIQSMQRKNGPLIEEGDSTSYPGLCTEYRLHIFEANVSGLPQREFETKEETSSSDDLVKWHTWSWGSLPLNIKQALA